MPRINRIRIINSLTIMIRGTYSMRPLTSMAGERSLNLANGGGKSVLVQLFMQPVVPGVTIQGAG